MYDQMVDLTGHFYHEDRVLASKGEVVRRVGTDGSQEENLAAETLC